MDRLTGISLLHFAQYSNLPSDHRVNQCHEWANIKNPFDTPTRTQPNILLAKQLASGNG
jgi:hypothetical protein